MTRTARLLLGIVAVVAGIAAILYASYLSIYYAVDGSQPHLGSAFLWFWAGIGGVTVGARLCGAKFDLDDY